MSPKTDLGQKETIKNKTIPECTAMFEMKGKYPRWLI